MIMIIFIGAATVNQFTTIIITDYSAGDYDRELVYHDNDYSFG